MKSTETFNPHNCCGVDKIQRYGWNSDEKNTVITKIHKTKINIDKNYQRDFSERKLSEIRKNWDNVAAGTITVAKRQDGTLWCVDGQHRLRAALDRSDVQYLDCVLFESSGAAEEAARFKSLNTSRKQPTSIQLHRAGLVAGDPEAIEINNLLTKHNILLGSGGRISKSSVSCRCVGVLKELSKMYGLECVDEALRLLSSIQNNGSCIDSYVLRGLVYVLKKYELKNYERFVSAFSKCTPSELKSSITLTINEHKKGGDRLYALGVVNEVNSHLKTNKFHVKKGE